MAKNGKTKKIAYIWSMRLDAKLETDSYTFKCEGTNESLTVQMPKLSPAAITALSGIRDMERKCQQIMVEEIEKAVENATQELYNQHPELSGKTLRQLGLQAMVSIVDNGFNITFQPL